MIYYIRFYLFEVFRTNHVFYFHGVHNVCVGECIKPKSSGQFLYR